MTLTRLSPLPEMVTLQSPFGTAESFAEAEEAGADAGDVAGATDGAEAGNVGADASEAEEPGTGTVGEPLWLETAPEPHDLMVRKMKASTMSANATPLAPTLARKRDHGDTFLPERLGVGKDDEAVEVAIYGSFQFVSG